MSHLRRLTVFVDEPNPGEFHWLMIECLETAGEWTTVDHSTEAFPTWGGAIDAGMVALHMLVDNEDIGPRSPGTDAGPVG